MEDLNSSDLPPSPFQSSSHPTSDDCIKYGDTSRRQDFGMVLKRLHFTSRKHLHSPSGRRKFITNGQVPNAPRPSLQINEDTVLFVNKARSSKLFQVQEFRNVASEDLRCFTGVNTVSETIIPQHSIPQQTSTPFPRRNSNIIDCALIGAPRLALNMSLIDSSDEHCLEPDRVTIEPKLPPSAQVSLDDSGDGESPPPGSPSILLQQSPQGRNTSQISDYSNSIFRCRICLEEGDMNNTLLSPCRCKGTVGLVHRACLQRWMYQSGKLSCELCGYVYGLRPSSRKSNSVFPHPDLVVNQRQLVQDWFGLPVNRRHTVIDLCCLIVLTPCTYIGAYFCMIGAINFQLEKPHEWQFIGLWLLAILLIILLHSWMVLAVRHHVSNFQRYRRNRLRRHCEAEARLASLPRWRFSIVPRPRGSSVIFQTSSFNSATIDRRSNASRVDSARGEFPPHNQTPIVRTPEVEVEAHLVPSSGCANIPGSKLVVSVALSTVPEVTEEYPSPNTIHSSPESV